MPDILYGRGAYRRDNGNFPEFKLVNMFLEETAGADGGVSLLSFPGMASTVVRGAGPINGIYQRSNLFAGAVFTISGNTLYKDGTSLGTVAGTGPVSWASSDIELVVSRGGAAYSYNGTNLAAIAFPDAASVIAVTGVIGGLFVFARAGSGRFYWSAVYDARTINALNYATAESAPDKLRDIIAIGDNVYMLGEDTIEVWYITGDLTLPFSRISQRTTRVGVIATGCAIEVDNALHFIGDNRVVYRMAEVPTRISDHGIEERIGQSTSWSCFSFMFQGHNFFSVRLSQGTWAIDVATSSWCEKQTWGLANWVARCAINLDAGPLFGSSAGGDVLAFSGYAEGTSPLLRQFTGAMPIKGGSVPIDILEIETNAGAATATLGVNAEPKLEMRFSRNGGDTWSNWRAVSMGKQGQYRKRPRFRRLGYFDAPGALFDFRCTEAAPFRVSNVIVNESAAGRSR